MAEKEIVIDMNEQGWVLTQKKAFTGWANHHLMERELCIRDVTTDLADGVLLVNLMEILNNGQSVGKYNAKPKLRVQKVENISLVFRRLKEVGIKMVNIGPGDIVDGNLRLILGLLWTCIHFYQIQAGQVESQQIDSAQGATAAVGNLLTDKAFAAMTARESLLQWCRHQVEEFEGISVDNFSASFKDGKAFSVLVYKEKPEAIDMALVLEGTPEENLTRAFRVAEKELNIPKLLDVEDILCKAPDEQSIMTYVSYFRSAENDKRIRELQLTLERSDTDARKRIAQVEQEKQEWEKTLMDRLGSAFAEAKTKEEQIDLLKKRIFELEDEVRQQNETIEGLHNDVTHARSDFGDAQERYTSLLERLRVFGDALESAEEEAGYQTDKVSYLRRFLLDAVRDLSGKKPGEELSEEAEAERRLKFGNLDALAHLLEEFEKKLGDREEKLAELQADKEVNITNLPEHIQEQVKESDAQLAQKRTQLQRLAMKSQALEDDILGKIRELDALSKKQGIIYDLRIRGDLMNGSKLEAMGRFMGCTAENSVYQWFRATDSRRFYPIPGATNREYVPVADDVGAILRVEVTPILPGNAMGKPHRAETGLIEMDPDQSKKLMDLCRAGKANFTVEMEGQTKTNYVLQVKRTRIKVRVPAPDSNKKPTTAIKTVPDKNFQVVLNNDNPRAFTVFFNPEESRKFLAKDSLERDLVVITLRSKDLMVPVNRLRGPSKSDLHALAPSIEAIRKAGRAHGGGAPSKTEAP